MGVWGFLRSNMGILHDITAIMRLKKGKKMATRFI